MCTLCCTLLPRTRLRATYVRTSTRIRRTLMPKRRWWREMNARAEKKREKWKGFLPLLLLLLLLREPSSPIRSLTRWLDASCSFHRAYTYSSATVAGARSSHIRRLRENKSQRRVRTWTLARSHPSYTCIRMSILQVLWNILANILNLIGTRASW